MSIFYNTNDYICCTFVFLYKEMYLKTNKYGYKRAKN
jgi:hypothetical protein